MFKRIWKDPVGSKIIAWSIIGLIGIISVKLTSLAKGITFQQALSDIYEFKVRIVYVALIVLVSFIMFRVFKKKRSYYSKAQNKLRKFNRSLDPETGILYKWKVYFKSNGDPFIADLEFYCTKHDDIPIRFVGNNCPMNGCKNSRVRLDEFGTKNHIESIVINEWEKINS
ncbi:hypothetical protein [Maribacter sp. LLG6340-A2]|uniref:hypothetical protein n=1 Tax=Maribacter sp. LLG6340-A2 TaxID=3160834 RepID=UPI00386FE0F3